MKIILLRTVLSFFLVLAALVNSTAQITINSTDMPSVNNQFVVNSATPTPSINPVPTGANFNWDFSSLSSASQNTDTFTSLINIQSLYAFAFIGSSYALRSAQDISLGGQLTFSKIYNVYKNSSAKYEYSGQGAEINSIPTPMVYSPKDLVYKFPLNFGNTDSSSSGFTVTIPTLGAYGKSRKRVNVVDGWGTLVLPSGTYNVLRVKSTISDRDSIVITGFPFPIVLPSTTTEYKWLGTSQGEPLLQINAGLIGVTQVLYLANPVGINETNELASSLLISPSPATDAVSVFYQSKNNSENSVAVFNVQGEKVKVIFNGKETGNAQHTFSVKGLPAGIYFLRIASDENVAYKKFAVTR
ncbi:MAG: T9SS type A sorting domain-containing protein [Bacteroidia bacterium]|nr:T9SS type A sorting domain-containing protein [Bacteroidia bacterium]